MRKTTRILTCLLAFVFLLFLSSCIGTDDPSETSRPLPGTTSGQAVSAGASEQEPVSTPEDLSSGQQDDSSGQGTALQPEDPMLRSFLDALSDSNDLVVQTAFLSMRVYMDAALLDPGTDCASWKSAIGEEGDCYAMAKLTVGDGNCFAYAQGDYLLYGESDFNIDFEPVYCKVEPFQTENPEPFGLLEPVYAILSDWKETFREACGRIEKLENVSWKEEEGVPYGEEGYCITNAETGERLFYRKDFYGAVYVGLEYLDEYGSQIAYAQFSPPDEPFPAQAFDGSQTVPSGRYQPFVRNLKEYSDKLLGKN